MTHVKFNHIEIRNIKTILKQYIDEILARYNESSSKEFLEKARRGIYMNAEDDAVELRQLLLFYTNLQEILNNL